jgi:UDP-GlcNAc:undecaprenyl-phosphate/decaprenyl-phosphate GlcNAc-1-phosphate transferase
MRAYLLVALISALVTFALTWVTLKISHRYKLYPQIRARDVHTKPTPRLGGVAMFGGFVVALAAAGALGWFKSVFAEPVQIIAIVVAAFMITLIGFLDDLYDLDWTLEVGRSVCGRWHFGLAGCADNLVAYCGSNHR